MSIMTTVANPLERIANDPHWLRQFSVDEYHKMIESGVFVKNNRVELLEGWIVNKNPQTPPHASSVGRMVRQLCHVLPESWTLRVLGPLTLDDSEPEPDIALARGEEGTYDSRHPVPTDIGVLMEIGDSTVLTDRRYKGELHAKAKVPEFWLINVVERKIEVYARPRGGKYQKKIEFTEKQSVPLILDGVKVADIPVGELLAKE